MSTKRKELIVADIHLADEGLSRLTRIRAMAQGIAEMGSSPSEIQEEMGTLGYAIVAEASDLLNTFQNWEKNRRRRWIETEKTA